MQTKFNSAICTSREQSERLLALGLKKETADMVYKPHSHYPDEVINYCEATPMVEPLRKYVIADDIDFRYYIPAWSLHKLIMMMPSAVYQGDSIRYFMIEQGHNVGYWYFGEDDCELCKVWSRQDLYNNIIDCIEWLIKEGYFNKEYLE